MMRFTGFGSTCKQHEAFVVVVIVVVTSTAVWVC